MVFCKKTLDDNEERPYTSFNLTRDNIVITSGQIKAIEAKYPHLTTEYSVKSNAIKSIAAVSEETPKKGGAKKHPFQDAMEIAYLYFLKNEKMYVLMPGKRLLFIDEIVNLMKRANISCEKNEQEIIKQLEERIELPRKVGGVWKITSQEFQDKEKRGRAIPYVSKIYEIKHVSSELNSLRKKHQLSLQDSHS